MKANLWFLLLALLIVPNIGNAQKAFPTAEGFGANAKGGRGGAVYEVTNLNDAGSGSLRACIEANGPRTCIFRVGGTITLDSGLVINNPFVTIAGQTAPGGGILLRRNPDHDAPLMSIRADDVIVRHIRFRGGATSQPTCCADVLHVGPARNVILDHNSLSWSVDEIGDLIGDAENITFQWNIFSEGLNRSTHKNGRHSAGFLGAAHHTKTSMHHNLFAHNNKRSPKMTFRTGQADTINNLIYNSGSQAIAYSNSSSQTASQGSRGNVIGNYFERGPGTSSRTPFLEIEIVSDPGTVEVYLEGNIDPRVRPDNTIREDAIVLSAFRQYVTTQKFATAPIPVQVTGANQARTDVLAKAGARLPQQDSVDVRIINDVKNRTGSRVDFPDDVGGYPTIANGTAPTDTDKDGMPDVWERKFGLDPNDPNDRNGDFNSDGYTNLEDYLNELAGDITVSGGTTNNPTTPEACHTLNVGHQPLQGFAVAYDLFSSTQELLLNVTCDETKATIEVGTGVINQYIYEVSYRWDGSTWQQNIMTGPEKVSTWFIGSAGYDVPHTESLANEDNYFVAYVCTWTGTEWKCGCADTTCATPMWQVQGFRR